MACATNGAITCSSLYHLEDPQGNYPRKRFLPDSERSITDFSFQEPDRTSISAPIGPPNSVLGKTLACVGYLACLGISYRAPARFPATGRLWSIGELLPSWKLAMEHLIHRGGNNKVNAMEGKPASEGPLFLADFPLYKDTYGKGNVVAPMMHHKITRERLTKLHQ